MYKLSKYSIMPPKKDTRPAPQILKVRDVKEDDRFAGIHENLPKMPCLGLLIGSVRSGKSNLLVNMFMNDDFYRGTMTNFSTFSTDVPT